MKKLRLEVDDLRIDSFAVDGAGEARGTVAGQNEPAYTASCDGSCVNTCNSCVNTCLNTCQASCWNTCGTFNATCGTWCTHPG